MATAVTSETDSNSPSRRNAASARPARFWTMAIASLIAALSAVIGVIAFFLIQNRDANTGSSRPSVVIPAPYDAGRAEAYLKQICALGPRPSGSPAMEQQQKLLVDFFTQQGGAVELQPFDAQHPETRQPVRMNNLIARWYPDRTKRFLICAHYDTRPFPDRDPINPQGRFVGANDGGSGVAALMELSHHLSRLPADVGVDLVLFDGEELVYQERRDDYFLGSTHFAREHVRRPPPVPYQSGILLDMIGDRELKVYYERNSWNYARDVCKSVFDTAAILGADAFVARVRHEVRDDHLPLNEIAKIPTIDLIDFDYPRPGIGVQQYWHTTKDVPENCSGHSIATVVYVVHQWLMRR